MGNKKILYVSYDGMTDPLGQSQVIPYLIGLAKNGYDITLLSTEKCTELKLNKQHIANLLEENSIKWEYVIYHKRPPILATLIDVYNLKQRALILHQEIDFKIIHCRSYIAALIGLYFKKNLGLKFIFDMRGFWADERVDGGIWNLKNPLFKFIYNYFKKKERHFLERADAIICLTNAGKKEMISWELSGKTVSNIHVIPCCVDLELFNEDVSSTGGIRKSLGLGQDDFVLSYLGSIGTWYMLPEMIDFFKVLKMSYSSAKFLFITKENESTIRSCAREKGVFDEDVIIRSAERVEVKKYLAISDLSIFFIKPAYSKIASSPTKQGEIMAMEIPLICNEGIGDTDYIINKYSSGVVVKCFDQEHYENGVASFRKSNFVGLRQGAEDYFSLREGVKSYINIYKLILD